MKGSVLCALGLVLGLNTSFAFNIQPPPPHQQSKWNSLSQLQGHIYPEEADAENDAVVERRFFFAKVASAVAFSSVAVAGQPTVAHAADAVSGPTIWNSGKQPKVPGQKPKAKNDTSGTRKDGNFLRSIADCKSQCENTTGPDGFSRSKEECLSDCQDICCKTYEQCTFAIVPRM